VDGPVVVVDDDEDEAKDSEGAPDVAGGAPGKGRGIAG